MREGKKARYRDRKIHTEGKEYWQKENVMNTKKFKEDITPAPTQALDLCSPAVKLFLLYTLMETKVGQQLFSSPLVKPSVIQWIEPGRALHVGC